MENNIRDLRTTEVIAASMKIRYSGVTSTVAALLPVHAKRLPIAALGGTGVTGLFGFDADVRAGQVVIEVPSAGSGVWRVEGCHG